MPETGETSNAAPAPAATAPRGRIVEALMALAAERPFDEITITEIATRAAVSLADFRDLFPSKGAALAGFSKQIDRIVLEGGGDDIAADDVKERLFDVLMRRLDAMTPYKEGLRGVSDWLRREPLAALAINGVVVNSMRFMLEAAGIESEGAVGAVKLQGLVFAWTRILGVWLADDEEGASKTMAAIDRELSRGERMVTRMESVDRFAGPFKALARAVLETRHRAGEAMRGARSRRERDGDERAHRL
jgi:AcrR family transcriptional regulator